MQLKIHVLISKISLVLFVILSKVQSQTFYSILGLPANQNLSEIQVEVTFKKLQKELMPKIERGDATAAQQFRKIKRAREVLTDRTRVQYYNAYGQIGLYKYQTGEGEIVQNKGQDAVADIHVTLQELYSGTQRIKPLSKNVICPKCSGTGAKGGKMKVCKNCQGRGVVYRTMGGGAFSMQIQEHCHVCGGRGKTIKQRCDHCHGSKIVPDTKDLKVKIQPGTSESDKIIFLRQSEQRPGMTPGDVVFNIIQQKHDIFERVGSDLYATLKVSLKQYLNGFVKKIKTISGKQISISKPVNSGFQEIFRFPGQGMPIKGRKSIKGDLIIRLQVQFPKSLSHEEEVLIQQIF